ncbi:MAG: bifunctional UDP-3-O-[3-hydroxymyristoyl] N-acetylglucosamine deacetylase/3-hydroxyacyl-ACP dehydratase [Mucinivorans sp.]
MIQKQQTLAQAINFSGKTLHTGAEISMVIKPAEIGFGICFCRTDLPGSPIIEALAENVKETTRSTVLEKNGTRLSTVEHLLAALWAMGVDNALVEVGGAEIPISDGSAAPWAEAIAKAGLVEQDAPRSYFEIDERLEFTIPERDSKITVYPDDKFSISVHIDFNSKVVGKQYATYEPEDDFVKKIAPCRTFVFLHEIEPLIKDGLIKGGDLDNAIVIIENPLKPEQAAEVAAFFGHDYSPEPLLKSGFLTNGGLRFQNEIARHKMLDLYGDLALIGQRINGKVIANKPGHLINTEFAKAIRKVIKSSIDKPRFKYDPNVAPVYDINKIRTILPHRPPFLLVDKIIHISQSEVVGIKQVTMNEPFFVGHFPNEPVMPGVLQVEAMAQCGGILAMSHLPDPENYSTYFIKIDGVKFKRKVVPGDTLQFELELVEPIRRGIVQMHARAYVGDTLACEAMLVAMISKTKK